MVPITQSALPPMIAEPPALVQQQGVGSEPFAAHHHHVRLKDKVGSTIMISETTSFDNGDELLFHEKPKMEPTLTLVQSNVLNAEQRRADVEQQDLTEELKAHAIDSMESGHFLIAEETFRHVLHRQHQGNTSEEEMITTLANLGKCCELSGRPQEAMSCYNHALHIKANKDLQKEPESVQLLLASILYEVGMIHSKFFMGNTSQKELAQKAIKAFSVALKLRESCLGEQHHSVASAYHNIAAVLTTGGMPSAAVEHHEKALAIRRSVLGNRHPEVASSLRHLATAHKILGNYQDAARYLTEALDILKCVPYEGFLSEVLTELSLVRRWLKL